MCLYAYFLNPWMSQFMHTRVQLLALKLKYFVLLLDFFSPLFRKPNQKVLYLGSNSKILWVTAAWKTVQFQLNFWRDEKLKIETKIRITSGKVYITHVILFCVSFLMISFCYRCVNINFTEYEFENEWLCNNGSSSNDKSDIIRHGKGFNRPKKMFII